MFSSDLIVLFRKSSGMETTRPTQSSRLNILFLKNTYYPMMFRNFSICYTFRTEVLAQLLLLVVSGAIWRVMGLLVLLLFVAVEGRVVEAPPPPRVLALATARGQAGVPLPPWSPNKLKHYG